MCRVNVLAGEWFKRYLFIDFVVVDLVSYLIQAQVDYLWQG